MYPQRMNIMCTSKPLGLYWADCVHGVKGSILRSSSISLKMLRYGYLRTREGRGGWRSPRQHLVGAIIVLVRCFRHYHRDTCVLQHEIDVERGCNHDT